MSRNLYAEYIKERENRETIEKPWGFITYSIDGELCDIDSVYVVPEYRRSKAASTLADEVVEIAKAKGCKTLVGYVDPEANNAHASIQVQFGYGFKFHSVRNNLLVFTKDI